MPVTEGKMQPEPAEGRVSSTDLVQPPELPSKTDREPTSMPNNKSNEEIAQEVLAGYWSRGAKRRELLKKDGYDPSVIQEEIDKIINR